MIGGSCDFCFALLDDCAREYKTRDFEIKILGFESRGAFVACGDCSVLIDAGNMIGLVDRATELFSNRHGIDNPIERDHIRRVLRKFYREFQLHRIAATEN